MGYYVCRLKYHDPALQEDPPLVEEADSAEPSPRHHQQWLDDVKSVAHMLTVCICSYLPATCSKPLLFLHFTFIYACKSLAEPSNKLLMFIATKHLLMRSGCILLTQKLRAINMRSNATKNRMFHKY